MARFHEREKQRGQTCRSTKEKLRESLRRQSEAAAAAAYRQRSAAAAPSQPSDAAAPAPSQPSAAAAPAPSQLSAGQLTRNETKCSHIEIQLLVASRFNSVEQILRCNPTINLECVNGDGDTPLLVAAKHNNVKNIIYLLQGGASPNACDSTNATPLTYCANNGEIACRLLQAGARPNVMSGSCFTPLLIATRASNIRNDAHHIVALLKFGADPNFHDCQFEDDHNSIPLAVAINTANLSIVRSLFIASVELGGNLSWLENFMSRTSFAARILNDIKFRQVYEWVKREMEVVKRTVPPLTMLCFRGIRSHFGDRSIAHNICQERPYVEIIRRVYSRNAETKTLFAK